jgi:hypothetical protein
VDKIDYKKVFRESYGATAKPAVLEVPHMSFLMLDGAGDPETSPRFQAAIEALFGLAYTLKFMIKKGPMALDFTVMPLEGLWWAEDMARFRENRAAWQWRLMIMQPPVISAALVDEAATAMRARKKSLLLDEMRFERFEEGKAVQLLHVGPFSAEGPAVERLHRYAEEQQLALRGLHHEVYLSDMRRAAPERWKTILRQPVASP